MPSLSPIWTFSTLATSLVEEAEAHVLIGLLLSLLLLLLGRSGLTTTSRRSGGSGTTASGDGSELGGTLGDQLQSLALLIMLVFTCTDLLDVLALELTDELAETLLIGVNADGRKDVLDIGGGGRLVAGERKEEVSGHVLHFDGFLYAIKSVDGRTAIAIVQGLVQITYGVIGTRESIDLTASWTETETFEFAGRSGWRRKSGGHREINSNSKCVAGACGWWG